VSDLFQLRQLLLQRLLGACSCRFVNRIDRNRRLVRRHIRGFSDSFAGILLNTKSRAAHTIGSFVMEDDIAFLD
jgi:hypothetical protein